MTQKFIPMLFSTPMVKAILNETKTETRRTQGLKKINENPNNFSFSFYAYTDNVFVFKNIETNEDICIKSKIKFNDVIWVRETFFDAGNFYIYKADKDNFDNYKWRPSLFMPKDACRIFLKCVSVHVERLQDIDEQSAINEGIERIKDDGMMSFRSYAVKYDATVFPYVSFQTLWQKINGKESWNENPFVFVYKFEKIEKPDNFI